MSNDEDVVRTVYLTGQPGSGKTELARQYGEQFRNATSSSDTSKPLVITLDATKEESLVKSIEEVMQKLQPSIDIEPTHHSLVVLLKQLREFFRGYNGAWLLIIDDMFGNDFNHLLPRPGSKEWGGGQVLVTTQDNNLVQACHQSAKKFSLNEGMTREDAFALLKKISGVEVDDFAEEIIKEFKNLPLALACCATYVGEVRQDRPSTEFGWKEYLKMYRENECAQLESRTFCSNDVYPFSMAAATELAVRRMAETSDVLRLTFSFLSYCSLVPVPLNVLARYVKENLPSDNDKQVTTKENVIFKIQSEISRCTLLIYGLSQNVETIKCHQVIHGALMNIQNTKPVEQQEVEFVKMMKSLNETLDFMDNTYKEDVLLKVLARPHLTSFIDHANDMSWNNTAEFVLISMKKGQFLFLTSNMPEKAAVESLELLHNISLELQLSNEERCDILANLGFYYLELGRDEEALTFLCEAYRMTEGKSDNVWLLLRCRITYNLARTYNSMGSVDLAIEMMKRSIDLAKKVYVKEEDKVMNRFSWLFIFHLCWQKFGKLEAVVKEAMDFFLTCAPDSETLSRASCLAQLSYICFLDIFIGSFIKPWKSYDEQAELHGYFMEKSINLYEQILGTDVFCCPEYCQCFIMFAMFEDINENPTERIIQLEQALEHCDKLQHRFMVAYKERLCNNPGWLRSFFCRVRNIAKGRLVFADIITVLDDILEDYHSGTISPSRRVMNTLKGVGNFFVWLNYVIFLLIIILIVTFIFHL